MLWKWSGVILVSQHRSLSSYQLSSTFHIIVSITNTQRVLSSYSKRNKHQNEVNIPTNKSQQPTQRPSPHSTTSFPPPHLPYHSPCLVHLISSFSRSTASRASRFTTHHVAQQMSDALLRLIQTLRYVWVFFVIVDVCRLGILLDRHSRRRGKQFEPTVRISC